MTKMCKGLDMPKYALHNSQSRSLAVSQSRSLAVSQSRSLCVDIALSFLHISSIGFTHQHTSKEQRKFSAYFFIRTLHFRQYKQPLMQTQKVQNGGAYA